MHRKYMYTEFPFQLTTSIITKQSLPGSYALSSIMPMKLEEPNIKDTPVSYTHLTLPTTPYV